MDGGTGGSGASARLSGGCPRRGAARTRHGLALGLVLASLGCGGGGGGDRVEPGGAGAPRDEGVSGEILPLERARPYRPAGSYAEVLARCALVERVEDACTLETLPFLGDGTRDPTLEEVLERTLVTHDWMGRRFGEVLAAAPPEMLRLFGSVTAVVIGSEVRPSYYWSGHGAIFLDPAWLWTTVTEKRTVSRADDPRADNDRELGFLFWIRAVRGEERAWRFVSLASDEPRAFEDMFLPAVSLLYHELAHANDYMPRTRLPFVDPSLRPGEATDAVASEWGAWLLTELYPLLATELDALAEVNFFGAEPSETQKAYTPSFLGALMDPDGAAEYYAYSTDQEDLATLFEAAMMFRHHGVRYNVAFTDRPIDTEDYGCEDIPVGWGSRNRLGDPWVLERARYALVLVLDDPAATLDDTRVGATVPMRVGESWCTNHSDAPPTAAAGARSRELENAALAAENAAMRRAPEHARRVVAPTR